MQSHGDTIVEYLKCILGRHEMVETQSPENR